MERGTWGTRAHRTRSSEEREHVVHEARREREHVGLEGRWAREHVGHKEPRAGGT